MRITTAQAELVQRAAEDWARNAGFGSAQEVPFQRAPELIAAVAGATQLPSAQVRDALLARAAVSNDAAGQGLKTLGAEGAYRGASVHTPLEGAGGMRPMAARLQGTGAVAQMSALNASFVQTADDFAAARVVLTRRATKKTVREVTEACGKLLALFNQLDGTRDDVQVKTEIVRLYRDLLSHTARNKGVFLAKSTPENPIRSFRLDDTRAKDGLPDGARAPRGDDGLGLGSTLATDASGRTFVLDYHGEVTEVGTIGEFVRRRKEQLEIDAGADVLASDPKALADLRSLTDKGLARLGGDVEHVSLLEDDKNDLTRVYPTKWYREPNSLLSRRMVSDGPFRGIFLDDLVNELATRRGRGVDVDPQGGELPTTPKHGEPFVTTTTVKERGEKRTKLFIRIPENREWTEVRRSLRRLSQLEPAVKYRDGSKNTAFSFGPENYKLVRDIVGGMVVNGGARDLLQTHFDELTRVELAASDASLVRHTSRAIEGFRTALKGPDGKDRPFDLTYWQQKSLAWLEARGYGGVIALDTGMGKTLVAIGMMLELRSRKDEQRPFLYVGPPGLGGTMEAEIRKFCTPEVADALVKDLVVMDYKEFANAVRSGEHDGKKFDAKRFGGVFFDEAQWIKNRSSVGGAAALAFKHPHKVVLTKSVMKDGVDDVFTLASIANNVDLNDRAEGKELRYLMRKFRNLYTNVVGGRTVGVKESLELAPGDFVDPKHSMHAFIKSNFLHADKRVDDHKLPQFQLTAETLSMPPKMEADYRAKTKAITKLMRGMVSLYRDEGVTREYIDDKGRTRREINPLARDRRIADMFGVPLRKLIHEVNDLGNNRAKLDRAVELVWKHLEANPRARTVLFSDSASYVLQSAERLSQQIPGKIHAACLGKEIRLFQNGRELREFGGHTLPFKPKEYTDAGGRTYDKHTWHKFVLDKVIGANGEVATATMFGPIYQEGQNLQWGNVGIHLDRDTWSRQNTEQREGRLWRKGQEQKVTFHNLDWVYRHPKDDLDRSLDEVRGLYEKVSGDLFHDVIVVPQKMQLGEEWEGVRDRDELRVDTSVLEYALAPSIKHAAEKGGF